ncbi:MAG TPA: GDP-mannose 4,6-dehydratase [Candidatus Saccharimonadia bacterium]
MVILVTGAAGFVGRHLVELLHKSGGNDVYGTALHHGLGDAIMKQVDLKDGESVKRLLSEIKPEVIYHLAAFASPALSFKQPVEAITDTLAMQINLYEASLSLGISPRFLVVGSGQIYGRADATMLPLTEEAALDFASPYAVAKVGQEHLASMYAKRGIESVIARPFNHIGPGQQPGYLVSDLSKQVAELEKSASNDTLRVGNLSSKRDFTDVRDIVRAYCLLAEKGRRGKVYNVCSGKSTSGQDILDTLLSFSEKKIVTEQDPARMRPSDIPDLYGDASKLNKDTGWKPEIGLSQTLEDTLNYWRSRV